MVGWLFGRLIGWLVGGDLWKAKERGHTWCRKRRNRIHTDKGLCSLEETKLAYPSCHGEAGRGRVFTPGIRLIKHPIMPTSGVAEVRSRSGPSAYRANFLRCVTAYVSSLDNESSGITAPPASLQRKNCKKMLPMRPQNVLLMRQMPRSMQMKC